MGKGKNKKGNRKHDDDSSSDEEQQGQEFCPEVGKKEALTKHERLELQKKDAAEKRKLKQRCYVCGQLGHVRRLCPGRDDDGRGQSRHYRPKGQRGRKYSDKSQSETEDELKLPDGFAPLQNDSREAIEGESGGHEDEAFLYYDAGCESLETVEYLKEGRGKRPITKKEAIEEYQDALNRATETSNYGGRISRSWIKPGRPWLLSSASPIGGDDMVWFLIGLGRDFLSNDKDFDSAMSSLLETYSENESIVGFFSDLNYHPEEVARAGCDRESQLRRLICTCRAAEKGGVTVQIRVQPAAPPSRSITDDPDTAFNLQVMVELEQILTELIAKYPSLKVHLACWCGDADQMSKILRKFPDNIWIGIDASVTFSKVTRAHECAFDVPLTKVLLETGTPTTIPSVISRSKGREAFCHSGLIPIMAEAIAGFKSKGTNCSAADVGRAASKATLILYPRISNQ